MIYIFIYLLIGVAYSMINLPVMKKVTEKYIKDDKTRNKTLSSLIIIIVLTWPIIVIQGML